MQIKVCGITDRENMLEVARLRPEYMGFIFYADSPRDVSNKVVGLGLQDIPAAIDKVAVLVNHDLEKAIALVQEYGFQAVQLHGDEPPAYCSQLSEYCMVIKAFSVGSGLPTNLQSYEGHCDLLLFDAAGNHRGGNGEPFDHALLKGYNGSTPFFLGGGITHKDVQAVKALAEEIETMSGVDINSRFENSPGIKDISQLIKFMKGIRL